MPVAAASQTAVHLLTPADQNCTRKYHEVLCASYIELMLRLQGFSFWSKTGTNIQNIFKDLEDDEEMN